MAKLFNQKTKKEIAQGAGIALRVLKGMGGMPGVGASVKRIIEMLKKRRTKKIKKFIPKGRRVEQVKKSRKKGKHLDIRY